jgi:hypothetical protein
VEPKQIIGVAFFFLGAFGMIFALVWGNSWIPRLLYTLKLIKPSEAALAVADLLRRDPDGWDRGISWYHTKSTIALWVSSGVRGMQYTHGSARDFIHAPEIPMADRVYLWDVVRETVRAQREQEAQKKLMMLIDAARAAGRGK